MASSGGHRPKVIELAGNPTNGSAADQDIDPTAAVTTVPSAPLPSTENQPGCAVGYPPVIGYPQTEGHYLSHHSQPYNPYPYPTPPVPPPNSAAAGSPTLVFQPSYLKCSIVMTVVFSIILFLTVSIVLHIVLRPKNPVIGLNDFIVSNLNMSGSTLSADFEVNITVENPSKRLRVEFSIESQIIYKEVVLLSSPYAPTWQLGRAASTFIDLKSDDLGLRDSDTIEKMKKEMERTSSVSLGFIVYFSGKFKHSWWWSKVVDESFVCGDLKVDFGDDYKFGRLSTNNETIDCVLSS